MTTPPSIFSYGGGGSGSSSLSYCTVYMSAARTNLANGGALLWDTDRYDPDALHDTSSNTERFVANATGRWRLIGTVKRTSGSANDFLAVVSNHAADNGEAQGRYAFNNTGVESATIYWEGALTAAEYVQINHYVSTTNNIAGGADAQNGMITFERMV